MTYASLPSQVSRREQTAHTRPTNATADRLAVTTAGGLLSGTTANPLGAMLMTILRSRDEQAAGSSGASTCNKAPIKTSPAVASGSKCDIASPQGFEHGAVQSQVSASSALDDTVNPNNIILNDRKRYPGWACALILFTLIVATWSAIYFIVTAALSLGSGS